MAGARRAPRAMTRTTPSDAWTHATLARLAQEHFPGRSNALEELVRQLARRHETSWRTNSAGVFRPTPAMYALALRWQIEKLGPTCLFCKGEVELPTRPDPTGPSGPTLALGLSLDPERGGLNVPQNLVLGHADCLPGR